MTCSPHRRETTDVLSETLAGRSDVEVIPAAQLLPEVPNAGSGDLPAALAASTRDRMQCSRATCEKLRPSH